MHCQTSLILQEFLKGIRTSFFIFNPPFKHAPFMPFLLRKIFLPLVALYCFVKALSVTLLNKQLLSLLDLSAQSAAGRIEFMSVYAGFFLGLGIFLIWSNAQPQRRKSAFLLLALASGGTLSYRLALHLLWQTGGAASLLQLGGELLLCGGSIWGYKKE